MEKIEMFQTKNISFVKVSESLIDDYLLSMNDKEHVGKFVGKREKELTREDEIKWVNAKLANNDFVFSMIEKKSQEFIGNIELMDVKDDDSELGIAITYKKQELGYGTEAILAIIDYGFNKLKLKRIHLKAYPFNLRAIHVYKKCGFVEYDRDENDVFMEIKGAVKKLNS